MAQDHVSIVMATRNGAAHLPAQLASLAWQSHRNWSLFVSDDDSTDATRDVLANFSLPRPLRLTRGPCAGTSAANFLSALAHPDLPDGPVALADQDDVWLKGKLARALRRLGSAPGPALYAAESLLCDAGLRPLRRSRAPGAQPGFGNALVQNLFGGHTLVLNSAALALVRQALALLGPDGARGIAYHDWFLYQLVAGAGGRLLLDPLPVALYRQHGGNELGGSGDARAALRRLAMLASGRWGGAMRAQAQALARVETLLTAPARQTLTAYLAAPPAGLHRARALAAAGIGRASRGGQALMQTAALFGRV
ncbi:glycosyltransferase [Rhodobacter sp. Har01]|uniref:glycosyltransferase n=1 Tax=Rhodobacter sp. Har01 TaxID=2883999 RepID=UPI001D069456|nr:glycosyltransferase [Rhodobacter sp. Har01]MCB6178384.1 glycosyltransferase [Rhodobacter sp. Har01]